MIALFFATLVAGAASDGGTTEPTRFAVEVNNQGKTQVTSRSGQPVRVESQGQEKVLLPGQSAEFEVEKGEAGHPFDPASAPKLLAPNPEERLRLKPSPQNLLGPVRLSWRPVDSAAGYQIEVRKESAPVPALTLKVDRAKAQLPPLEEGRYSWTVRAVSASGEVGSASASRAFLLSKDSVRLDVQSTEWK